VSDTTDTDLMHDMAAVFAAYGELWNTQDFSRLKELWDLEEERPFTCPRSKVTSSSGGRASISTGRRNRAGRPSRPCTSDTA
jgi:hypothetical protein